jgi:sugar diacid utilization regulator
MPEAEPDIQITVNVDIQEKIRARRAHLNSMPSCKDDNVPEHVRRAREREERRLRAAEEKEYKSACLVTAAFLGWYARKRYPVLLAENAERLRRRRKEEAERKRRLHAILTIQSTWRMYVPRKRFVFIRDCKRRRDKNEKEIKRITKTIEKMPKETKKEIKVGSGLGSLLVDPGMKSRETRSIPRLFFAHFSFL